MKNTTWNNIIDDQIKNISVYNGREKVFFFKEILFLIYIKEFKFY